MNGEAVRLEKVARRFGDVVAVEDVTMTARPGTMTVLLGPNGAGKTTLLRLITGSLAPDRGAIRVFGADPGEDGESIRRRCGLVQAVPAFYERLSGYDNLRFASELYGLEDDGRIERSAARFGILDSLRAATGSYSTGMKARLAMARAVLHEPELLLLDEPTSGLDPESAYAVLDLIGEMASEGKTVIMSTHLLLEAEGRADQVVMLSQGRDVVSGAPGELVKRYWPSATVTIDAEDPAALDAAREMDGVLGFERNGGPATITIESLASIPDLVASLAAQSVRLTSVVPHKPTLEDLYFLVRSKESRSGGTGDG